MYYLLGGLIERPFPELTLSMGASDSGGPSSSATASPPPFCLQCLSLRTHTPAYRLGCLLASQPVDGWCLRRRPCS
eukprot:SAG22_NODE_205_length_15308_cov_20.539023_6_plen_76_part_00